MGGLPRLPGSRRGMDPDHTSLSEHHPRPLQSILLFKVSQTLPPGGGGGWQLAPICRQKRFFPIQTRRRFLENNFSPCKPIKVAEFLDLLGKYSSFFFGKDAKHTSKKHSQIAREVCSEILFSKALLPPQAFSFFFI